MAQYAGQQHWADRYKQARTRMSECCCMKHSAAKPRRNGLDMQLARHCCTRVRVQVLCEVRDGHTVLLTKGSCQQAGSGSQQALVVWHESTAGAAAQDLSCMPGLLATPCLHQVVDLAQLRSLDSSSSSSMMMQQQRGPLVVRAVVQSATIAPCFIHRWGM